MTRAAEAPKEVIGTIGQELGTAPSSGLPKRPMGQGLTGSCIGLGCMSLTKGFNGEGPPEEEGIAVIRAALEAGITLFNTADLYGPFLNEELLGKALKGVPRESIQITTKWGPMFQDGKVVTNSSPAYCRQCCESALVRLDTPYIDLFTLRGPLPADAPLESTGKELKALVEEGKIKHVGVSEISAAEIRRLHAVVPVTAIEQEWSLFARDIEEDLLPTCRELGIGVLAYSPLGKGILAGNMDKSKLDPKDIRLVPGAMPWFSDENLEKNLQLAVQLQQKAAEKGCTPGQLALAWLLAKAPDVIPIPGTRQAKHAVDFAGAAQVQLTPEEALELETIISPTQVSGDRKGNIHLTTYKGSGVPLKTNSVPVTARHKENSQLDAEA